MLNRVTLIGHLGKDPEIRRLESGVAVAKFTVATNEYYKDKENNLQTLTEWHDVVAWRSLAEQSEKLLRKGRLVYIEGRLTHRKYKTQDGQDRVATEIIAATIKVLDRDKREEGGSFSAENPHGTGNKHVGGGMEDIAHTPINEEDDVLPF